jgi:hypothetical protein
MGSTSTSLGPMYEYSTICANKLKLFLSSELSNNSSPYIRPILFCLFSSSDSLFHIHKHISSGRGASNVGKEKPTNL